MFANEQTNQNAHITPPHHSYTMTYRFGPSQEGAVTKDDGAFPDCSDRGADRI